VLVTVTLAALTGADAEDGDGADGDGEDDAEGRVPELTVTQSPVATDDSVPVTTLVNRVEVAQATTVVPELAATLTPELDTALAVPVAAVKPPKPPRPEVVGPPAGAPLEAEVVEVLLPDPHAATVSAVTARPAAANSRVRVGEIDAGTWLS
jgi:hypothetical protein